MNRNCQASSHRSQPSLQQAGAVPEEDPFLKASLNGKKG